MPLNLIHGPPNSGRAGLIRRRFTDALDRDPILVVPTVDDVYAFERELCEAGAVLGGTVMTFGNLFRVVASAGGSPPGEELTAAQRLRAIAVAIEERSERLGPLRRSASRPGFGLAFERLLDELQAAGAEPSAMAASPSAHLNDLATLFAGYTEVRDRLGRADAHVTARKAIDLLRDSGDFWGGRPVFLYGFDDLTPNQLALIEALATAAEVTMALPYEPQSSALAPRTSPLLERLRAVGVATETATEPNPGNTPNQLLFHLERGFGRAGELQPAYPLSGGDESRPWGPGEGLVLLRSAGERGEAEAIAAEVAKLVAAGAEPGRIAIAARDPERRGPLIASLLESYGVATALEAELPVAGTAVGGTLLALLESELGAGRASDLLRFMRGLSGIPPHQVDWFERELRRARVRDAAAALELWERTHGGPPGDLARLRKGAAGEPPELGAELARLAATIASRPLRGGGDGPAPGPREGLELRAAAAIGRALAELADPAELAPRPRELIATVEAIRFRAWSGPVEGRVRIASPYRLRAARFDHVFVASLQDGEFPRRERAADPFVSEAQRESLGLGARRDTESEERYLFHACLALPRERLFLSYRDSDENGAAEFRSPFLDDVRALLAPPPGEQAPDPVERSLTRGRDLASVVHPIAEAPSPDELARAIAARGPDAGPGALLAAAGAAGPVARGIEERLAAARAAAAAARAPGPLSNPAPIEALGAVDVYGGTTLEQFDLCSYRWFVGHELDPQPLDPEPEGLRQGGLMHAVLYRLYRDRPGGDPLPRPGSLTAWLARGRELVAELAAERGLGEHPADRAIVRRVEGLLARFLGEEAARETGGFEPWLLEAGFGEEEDRERPPLEIDGWRLHGAIDRVDRDGRGRALVIDYKLAPRVTAARKLEEEAKLQLQLYMVAVAELWGAEPVGGIYHPLRGGSERRPRGAVSRAVAAELAAYRLSRTDLLDAEDYEALLGEARGRAGRIVARMRRGDIRRDPGPRPGLRGHDTCPRFCDFAPICRRDRGPAGQGGER